MEDEREDQGMAEDGEQRGWILMKEKRKRRGSKIVSSSSYCNGRRRQGLWSLRRWRWMSGWTRRRVQRLGVLAAPNNAAQ
jgi:hypothetical protein